MTGLVRTRGGAMIHLATCRYAATGVPWKWAEDKDVIEIRTAVVRLRLKTCRYCKPLLWRR